MAMLMLNTETKTLWVLSARDRARVLSGLKRRVARRRTVKAECTRRDSLRRALCRKGLSWFKLVKLNNAEVESMFLGVSA